MDSYFELMVALEGFEVEILKLVQLMFRPFAINVPNFTKFLQTVLGIST